ncbi:twin-arginine translocase TatA/TatE family subunit [Microbacterium sp. ASV81]|uniref:Sec-independent protein translocase protein TatA n=1 Tax=Microbacterium capsulatum TaxID=3041921 RepID=A0ABU0XCL4_9MICO|nr:twin-arginine translocase TatA/TatE family subunit [Microbacterium sp. ASV81]MDQ4212847.1 twin-arginine translocase TatA/TatE family subunit [Microbacterium sp. ASV81]
MFAGLSGWHLLILLAIVLLIFGAAKLPALAKSMGQSARVFKGEMNAMKDEDAARKNGENGKLDSKADDTTPPSPRDDDSSR